PGTRSALALPDRVGIARQRDFLVDPSPPYITPAGEGEAPDGEMFAPSPIVDGAQANDNDSLTGRHSGRLRNDVSCRFARCRLRCWIARIASSSDSSPSRKAQISR